MYARITRFRYQVNAEAGEAADPQEALNLLMDLDGCRGAWALAPEGSETESTFFSLWDNKEQAESATLMVRPKLQQLLEKHQVTMTAPPETKVLEVLASTGSASSG